MYNIALKLSSFLRGLSLEEGGVQTRMKGQDSAGKR